MANNVIDELSLNISANAASALSNLSKLQGGLRNLAKTVGTVSSANTSLSKTFSALGHINVGSLGKAINELERLEKINLKNLDGKTIKLDIKFNGADEAERRIYAIQDAIKTIDTKSMARDFSSSIGIVGKDAKKLESVFANMMKDIASGGSGRAPIVSWMSDIDKNGLKLDANMYVADAEKIKTAYSDLYSFLKNVKIQVPNDVKDISAFKRDMGISQGDYMNLFSRKGGTGIDSLIGSGGEEFGDLLDPKRSFYNETRTLLNLDNDKEQIKALMDLIKKLREEASKPVDIKTLDAESQNGVWNDIITATGNAPQKMTEAFNNEVNKHMRESASKIPLDVKIDPSRIEKQIAEAVKQASGKTHNLPIKFNIDTGAIKTTVATALGSVDVSSMGQLTEHLKSAAIAMSEMGSFNPKDNGITSFVNSMARLASVDMSKFSGGALESIVGTISQISSMGDVSSGVNRLVSSLARLANAGEKTEQSATHLPKLGAALREVISGITSAGGLPSTMNALVASISGLANAGNKTGQTALQLKDLSAALIEFIAALQGAPTISNNVVQMIHGLGQLASSGASAGSAARALNKNMNGTSSASSRAAAGFSLVGDTLRALEPAYNRVTTAVRNLLKSGFQKITSGLDPSRLITPFQNLGGAVNGVTANVKTLLTTMVGFRGITGIFNGLKQSIMNGADVTEIDHIIESVFSENMVGYVQEWARSAIDNFGIAEVAAKRYAGTLSAMFQASKIGQNDAGKMGMDLTGLAGDLSAFYNIDTETAFNKIRSGMAGMVRPLRDLGIDLTAATLQEYALSQGITTAYSAMSQAEKVMLRYNYLMSVTKTQQGDFGRTSLSLANSLRTLKAYATAVSTQIGVGLGAALRHVVVLLNKVMKYVLKAAQAFATFMQTLFGKYKGGASGMAVDMSMAEDAGDSLADSSGSAADGLGDAADNAKKLKKELAVLPFDELNQLNKDVDTASTNTPSGSGGGGGAGGGGGIGDGLLDWEDMMKTSKLPDAINEWADRIKAAFKAHDWEALGGAIAWGINKGIDKLYDLLDPVKFKKKVAPFIDAFTTTFNSLVDRIHWEKMGRTVGRGINNIVWALNRTIEGIDWVNLGKKLAQGANGLVDEIDFRAVGNLIGNKFMIVWNILYGFAKEFDWARFGQQLGNGINGINEKISWARVATALTTALNGVFTSLMEFTKTVDWLDIAKNIASGINTAILTFHWKDNGKALGAFINDLLDAILYVVDNTNWTGIGEGIADFLQQIPWGKLLYTVGHAIVTALGGILKGMAKTPAGFFAGAFIVAMSAYKIGSALNPFVSKMITALTGSNVANPLGQGVVKLFKTVFSKSNMESIGIAMLYAKDAVVGGFSKILTGLSPIISKIGSVIQTIGSSTIGMSALAGGALAGLMLAAQKMSEKIDELKGGNGVLTDMGTALHEYTDQLAGATAISGEEANKLFQIIEGMEDSHASEAEMAQKVMEELQNMGVSYGQAKGYLDAYKQSGNQNVTMLDELERAMGNVYGEMDGYVESNDTYAQGMERLRDALYEAAAGNDQISANMPTLTAALSDAETHSATTADAYDLMKQRLEDYGITAEQAPAVFDVLNSKINESAQAAKEEADAQEEANRRAGEAVKSRVMQVGQILQQHAGDLQRTQEYARDELENWQSHVQAFYNDALEKFKGIGDGWGQLDANQEQTLESLNSNLEENMAKQSTALENMKKLNEAGLDGATVQAILNQIDPSSQAMTDLIEHMGKDDATWNEFHNNLQDQMNMTDDVTKTLDEMTTAYAKEIAPAFVTVGSNFQTEGGKLGGYMVAGLKGGLYDNVADVENAMKDTANFSLAAFKQAAGISSPSKEMFNNGMYLMQGLQSGISSYTYLVTQAVETVNKNISDKFSPEPQRWNKAGQDMVSNLASAIRTNATQVSQAFQGINGFLKSEQNTIGLYGTASGEDFVDNFKSNLKGLKSEVSDVLDGVVDVIEGFESSFERAGSQLSNAIANGFDAIDIPTPHLYISDWTWHDLGDGQGFDTPVFSVNWYRAGGLFRNASVIGVGEAGDEAVLPLENRRTMGMIADSIMASSDGSMGTNPREFADIVADRVAEAIISTQGEQRDIVVNAVLKTEDNEVLARAVTKGQRSLDYRNNPTPKLSY